jgi:hypothetical protein
MIDIDFNNMTLLIYDELHKAYLTETSLVIEWCFRRCSDKMQRVWEDATRRALIRAASLDGDKSGAVSLLVKRLSATGPRQTDFYTLAAVIYEELLNRFDVVSLDMERPWEARSDRTHEIWAIAIRKALARTGLSGESLGYDDFRLYLPRESSGKAALSEEGASSPSASESEDQQQPKRPWWRFWR